MRLPRHPPASARAGYAQLGYAAIALALSYIAGKLLAPKNKNPLNTDKPTTLAERGSRANVLVGIGIVGPVFAWAGGRKTKSESSTTGKGFGSTPDQTVYYEEGWHILGSNGPWWALHEIRKQGKTVFRGPITRDSHPSGSVVDLGITGSFKIYWGEVDQPVNTSLGAATRVGVQARWPYLCYVQWIEKRLGTTPIWPDLQYICEQRPLVPLLTGSPAYVPATEALTGPSKSIFSHTNGVQGVGFFTFVGDLSNKFHATRPVQLTGNSMATGRYVVLKSIVYQFELVPPAYPIPGVYETRTDTYLYGGVTGANNAGQLQAYNVNKDDGLNIAHGMAELLFAQWPHGIELDPNGLEPWDLVSLEAIGVESNTNRWVSTLIASNGESLDAVMASALMDLGVMVPIEYANGMISFRPVRPPSGTLKNIVGDLQTPVLPEIEMLHGPLPADRIVFKFSDREHDFSDETIAVDEDGHAQYAKFNKAKEVTIKSTTNFATAAAWAARRDQEMLAGGAVVPIKAARGTRELLPGDAILADGIDDVLRVTDVQVNPLENTVEIGTLIDYYGVDPSSFTQPQSGGSTGTLDPENDLQFAFLEVPEVLLKGDPMTILVPRVRANVQVVGANIHVSRDNSTYTFSNQISGSQTGGTLVAQLDATTDTYLAQGPTITALGPDIASVLDLTGDDTNWLLGRQICVISSSAGIEICYVRKLTALGGSSYRLDDLVRARYDTKRLTHPIGAEVYVFTQDSIEGVQDLLLVPDQILYVKSQPNTFAGSVALAGVSPDAALLYGKGVKPMELIEIETTAPYLGSPSFGTGQDIGLRWGYRSANELTSGAGQQGAGVATGVQVPLGTFTLEFLTLGSVLKRTVVVNATNAYTYTNASLVADFGSEVSFIVRVKQTVAGYSTPTIQLQVNLV